VALLLDVQLVQVRVLSKLARRLAPRAELTDCEVALGCENAVAFAEAEATVVNC